MANTLLVFLDYEGLSAPLRLGTLHAFDAGRSEQFAFEYAPQLLKSDLLLDLHLDPLLPAYGGLQYPPEERKTWGLFADASPDRWGRMLMKRRHERERRGDAPIKRVLFESDYLLGVHDQYRVGALRLRLQEDGPFLDDRDQRGAPPLVKLRELEAAVRIVESDKISDDDNETSEASAWVNMLIAPGGSLGGARPKASVVTPEGRLMIAKFPSLHDEFDVGGWEMLVHVLAKACGIRVADSRINKYASQRYTFLTTRFDRTASGKRLHFASAMTMTNHVDGEDESTGVSYLEIAQFLIQYGAQSQADLKESWTRILLNVLVSNTDDHLRNHGFLLVPGQGWRLSPAYDMNPVPNSHGLRLNIDEHDNALDLDLVRSVAPQFRVSKKEAMEIETHCKNTVRRWPDIANKIGLARSEISLMESAFRVE